VTGEFGREQVCPSRESEVSPGPARRLTARRKVGPAPCDWWRAAPTPTSTNSLTLHLHRKSGAQHDKWMEKDPERARTSSFRIGGIGSVLAVSICRGAKGRPSTPLSRSYLNRDTISSGAGTGLHYDNGDDGCYYSVIVVPTATDT
jgi:hypothetical protein